MNEPRALPDRRGKEQRGRPRPPAREVHRELRWGVLWQSGGRALLMSEVGHFMVYPRPDLPFRC